MSRSIDRVWIALPSVLLSSTLAVANDLSEAEPRGLSAATIADVTEELGHAAIVEDSEADAPDATASTEFDGDPSDDFEDLSPIDQGDSGSEGAAGSNPLASVTKVDLIWQYKKTTDRKHVNDFQVKASKMLGPQLKLNIEAHYWETNVTGESERDWEQISLKPVYLLDDKPIDDAWVMRLGGGLEYIHDFDNRDKGIGSGADQVAPLFGASINNTETRLTLIPFVQHFEDVESGADIRTTVFRFIALQPLDGGRWAKADLKLPRDWEDEEWPGSAELEVGQMFSPTMGVFVQGLAGIGGERPFTYGAALGLRLNF
jgi:hypothetical protein